jgi:hypothetical protein
MSIPYPPIITLEVSKISQHLRWCWRVGSGTQAGTQVLLAAAAAAGFPSLQLGGNVLFLGAKLGLFLHSIGEEFGEHQ